MNDRFLFRAFYEGRFIYKNLIDANYYTYDNKCIGLANTLPNSLKWEQCTGLKDKNGKLIYEGDIIEKQNQKFVIKYEFDSFVAYSEEKKPVSIYGLFTFKLCFGGWPEKETENTIEVIGNIHENPELVKWL